MDEQRFRLTGRLYPHWLKRVARYRVHRDNDASASLTVSYQPAEFTNFIHDHQPNLCDACINLASIFDNSLETKRDLNKEGASSINHHDGLIALLECSKTCPLCALIITAVPHQTEWLLWEIVTDILAPRYAEVDNKGDTWDRKGWLRQRLREWIFWLEYPVKNKFDQLNLNPSNWTNEYNQRMKSLGLPEAVPLTKILSGMQTESGGTENLLKINYWTQAIRVREQFAMKGQFSEFALSLQAERNSGLRTLSSGSLRISSSLNEPIAKLVAGRLVPARGGSPESLELAKEWIESCFHSHSECQWSAQNEDPPLPTRVIDVQGPDQDSVLLISSEGMRGKWLALSHRWPRGQGQIISLRETNVQSFKDGILLASLPPTFQDAIKITRFLGLQYLWIDSICIIQDSIFGRDWEAEAAKMPGVYQNAYITLAAAATEDGRGGIFVERAWAEKSMACEISIRGQNKRIVTIDLPLEHGLQQEEINYLEKRAWCFQESRLSHRLLTFDRLQMSYTCLRHGLLESRVIPHAAAREERNPFLSRIYAAVKKDGLGKTEELVSTWYQEVADYTSRSLTFQQDKLVAIAGMARIIGGFINDEYYAGLWKRNLPRALLWSPYEEETFPNAPHKASLPSSYRAPSWSWASVESPISNFLCRQTLGRKSLSEILAISTTLQGPDPYGQVKDGYLNIKAPFLEGMVGTASSNWPYQPNIVPLNFVFPVSGLSSNEEHSKFGHTIFDLEWLPRESRIWILQITEIYGLILLPAGTDDSSVFRRVGVCHFRSNVKIKTVASIKII